MRTIKEFKERIAEVVEIATACAKCVIMVALVGVAAVCFLGEPTSEGEGWFDVMVASRLIAFAAVVLIVWLAHKWGWSRECDSDDDEE